MESKDKLENCILAVSRERDSSFDQEEREEESGGKQEELGQGKFLPGKIKETCIFYRLLIYYGKAQLQNLI